MLYSDEIAKIQRKQFEKDMLISKELTSEEYLKLSLIHIQMCIRDSLQGRYDTYPKRRGLTRVKELNDAGINVCFAQDSISDPWYPLGNGNLMNILDLSLIHI